MQLNKFSRTWSSWWSSGIYTCPDKTQGDSQSHIFLLWGVLLVFILTGLKGNNGFDAAVALHLFAQGLATMHLHWHLRINGTLSAKNYRGWLLALAVFVQKCNIHHNLLSHLLFFAIRIRCCQSFKCQHLNMEVHYLFCCPTYLFCRRVVMLTQRMDQNQLIHFLKGKGFF